MDDNARKDANVVPAAKQLSRRNFFQLSGGLAAAGAGASLLSACSSSGSSTKSSGSSGSKGGKMAKANAPTKKGPANRALPQ